MGWKVEKWGRERGWVEGGGMRGDEREWIEGGGRIGQVKRENLEEGIGGGGG